MQLIGCCLHRGRRGGGNHPHLCRYTSSTTCFNLVVNPSAVSQTLSSTNVFNCLVVYVYNSLIGVTCLLFSMVGVNLVLALVWYAISDDLFCLAC